MSAIQIAAQRINASRAGLTGQTALPENEPGAQVAATPTEIADLVPTEFGGLSHIFAGGETAIPSVVPVNTAKTIPSGSVAGKLGGLAPDVRNTAQKVQQAVATRTKNTEPLSTSAKNTVAKARAFLKI